MIAEKMENTSNIQHLPNFSYHNGASCLADSWSGSLFLVTCFLEPLWGGRTGQMWASHGPPCFDLLHLLNGFAKRVAPNAKHSTMKF